MQVRYAAIRGITTRYYEAGAGPAVVFVHGLGAASDTWVRNIDPIADAGFHALAPDLPGHGFSDVLELAGRRPQAVLVEHLAGFIEATRGEAVHVVGSAFGALLAVLLHFERPELVKSLVLVGSASVFHPPALHGSVIDASLANQLRALENPTRETIRARNMGSNHDRADPFEEIVLVQLNVFARPDRLRVYREMTTGMRDSAGDPQSQAYHRLEAIRCPTLVVAGRSDPRADASRLQSEAGRIPDAGLRILEQCGHKPFSERASDFNREVVSFLSSRPP